MHKPTDMIEYETMLLLRHRPMPSYAQDSAGPAGHLDRSAYVLLTRIRLEGPMSIGGLSEAFGLDQSTLHRQTAAMMRDGLVERIPDPDGGIARKFKITDKGEHLLDEERTAIVRGLDRVMESWTPEDVAAFGAYLRRFNLDIETRTGRPWPRP